MSFEARYCKTCKVAFAGKVCPGGHPNFKYTKLIPAGVEVPEGAIIAPPPPPRRAGAQSSSAGGSLGSSGGSSSPPAWANRNRLKPTSAASSDAGPGVAGGGGGVAGSRGSSPRKGGGSAGSARAARLEMFLKATEDARERHDAARDLCQDSIAALKAAAGADATAKKDPDNKELKLKTAVLYARADHLLDLATTDTTGKVPVKVKLALDGKHVRGRHRSAAAALAASVSLAAGVGAAVTLPCCAAVPCRCCASR